jgi:hypothetical protein
MIYSDRTAREASMKRIASKRAPERSLEEALKIMDSLRQYRRLIKPARRKAGQCKR